MKLQSKNNIYIYLFGNSSRNLIAFNILYDNFSAISGFNNSYDGLSNVLS